MITKEMIFARIQKLLVEVFELDESSIALDSHIYEDLDLDSLDAVELAVTLGAETGITLREEELRAIRTIADAVDILYQRINV